MKKFEPIAIIGQGCVLPGCFSPQELWEMVYNNDVKIRDASSNAWRVDLDQVLVRPGETSSSNKAWNSKGGYVTEFDSHFDSNSFELDADIIAGLDPVFKWSFYAAQAALKDAGYSDNAIKKRTGLIMGNLSYPSRSFSKLFEEHHLHKLFPDWKNPVQPTAAVNRFMSGLPAILTSKALGLKGDSFALDAACASSLYALKLACDKLHSGREDMMLVGGVCASDQLFLHVGFTALNALSPSGQSRPFNENADGLIPSEGAGFIVIKRLKDAIQHKDNILGVVRGIGLSNDGKKGGFLLPSQIGQVKSMRNALDVSGIKPEEVSYVECHATGTSTGDSIEINSLSEVYGNESNMHLSSLKGNIGHSITASGAGSIIKVLEAFKHQTLPPVPNAFPINETLAKSGFSISDSPQKWNTKKNKIAGISNFGFGGNNAHVLIEEWNPKSKYEKNEPQAKLSKVAIVGVDIQSDKFADSKSYLTHLQENTSIDKLNESIGFDMKKLSSPPNDLKYTLGQQLLMLNTTQNLLGQNFQLDNENTGVFIGMGADAEINRYGFRKRIAELLLQGEIPSDACNLEELENAISPVLNSAGVLGTMPNIPANRINNHFDFCGMGFTVSCEELSGIKALDIAIQAIQNNELSGAVVGAVDLSNEPVNRAALSDVIDVHLPLSDAAVVLVLKNHEQALLDGDTIFATIDAEINRKEAYTLDKDWLFSKVGYSHASSGLTELATAVLFTRNRLQLNEDKSGLKPLLENNKGFDYQVNCTSLFGGETAFSIHSEDLDNVNARATGKLLIHCFSADNKDNLILALQNTTYSEEGVHRLGIVSTTEDLSKNIDLAILVLQKDNVPVGWISPIINYQTERISGELAFVFTGAAAAYPQMGKKLIEEFPGLVGKLQPYCNMPSFAGDWIYNQNDPKAKLPFYQLAGSSLMCQIHANFTKNILGIKPNAAIGLSSGETNSMYAFGVWDDMDKLLQEIDNSELYRAALGVDFMSVKKHWGLKESENVDWDNWRILAPVAEVKKALKKEERVYLTIINTDNDCVIGGDKSACDRIISVIGENKVMPLNHDIAVHCSPVTPYEKAWRKLHTRKVNKVEGIRFYSNYLDGVYTPTSEKVADVLTGQAIHTIDFPRIIKMAWEDGVRVFIEHGPRNSLKVAISEILKGKEFLCVSMDNFGQSDLQVAFKAATELWAAGVQVNLETLSAKNSDNNEHAKMKISFPYHPQEIAINKMSDNFRVQAQNKNTPVLSSTNNMEKAPQYAILSRNRRGESFQKNQDVDAFIETPSHKIKAKNEGFFVEEMPGTTQSEPANSALELLKNQHSLLLDAHENYLKVQLQGQKHYAGLMNKLMDQFMEAGNDEDDFQDQPFVEGDFEFQPSEMKMESSPPLKPESQIKTSGVLATSLNEKIAVHPIVEADKNEIELPGPAYSRAQLEVLASGKISSVLGPLFEKQDEYEIQVRMPEPPLLLCDRVTGIKGEPGTLGLGTIWTETDVLPDSWYLHNNRMPPGIFIEAGQADLLLISYLGIDFQNKGERAYRLLGCELTFYGELPQPGETLKYDIHVDGYAKSGETTLFFFHYDCHIDGKLRISVREGQAGFFSNKELEESKGVIWDPETAKYAEQSVNQFENATKKTAFSGKDIEEYTKGNMVACFGPELDWTHTHTRSPRSQGGYQNFIKNVTAFDLAGGPAKRGYLRSETIVRPDDWYFKGHFKNDECMPGTLMADACLQMMAFYMVGTGLTSTKDGWRFEPVTEEKYKFVCRGQVTPISKKVIYEIFVDEIIDGDFPTIYAHVLTTVDGNKAFLCERIGLRLVPDWPLATMRDLVEEDVKGKRIASYKGFKFGYESLINCALGRPADAFGPDFNHYDGAMRSPRLPGPPYHFMTRIADYNVVPGEYKNNPYVVAEYDIPEDVWYFSENGKQSMPYGVLMEVALQPCGWFSTFVCQNDIKGKDLLFRNLDGTAVQHREIVPSDKTIETKTTLTGVSIMGEIIIVKFEVLSSVDGEPVFTMNTVFGFFDTGSMKTQKGIAITKEEQSNLALKSNCKIDLTTFPEKYFKKSTACLPASKLLMIDRIVSFYKDGGKHKKGYIKSEKDVRKSEWFFKAHFFQDPVQPGSLGIEAMVQLMQFYMLDQGLDKQFANPTFEPIALQDETEWHYRGQVTPDKKLISVDFEVEELRIEKEAITVIGEARLWVDGLKIYHAPKIGMRIIEGTPPTKKMKNADENSDSSSWDKIGITDAVELDQGGMEAVKRHLPFSKLAKVPGNPNRVSVGKLDLKLLIDAWFGLTGYQPDFIGDLRTVLIEKFVRRVVFKNYEAIKELENKPVLYLANHQTGVESSLFLSFINVFNGIQAKAIAKIEHKDTWMGKLVNLSNTKYDNNSPISSLMYDRNHPDEFIKLLVEVQQKNKIAPCSLLVHVDGTRQERAGDQVMGVSAVLLDYAIGANMPIVPVKFCCGLPEHGNEKFEFPFEFGKQDYYIGNPIYPSELSPLSLMDRGKKIANEINGLTSLANNLPVISDVNFKNEVDNNRKQYKVSLSQAVFISLLEKLKKPSKETSEVLKLIKKKGKAKSPMAESFQGEILKFLKDQV